MGTGFPMIKEINPSGQWGCIEHATGRRITEAIVDVLDGLKGGDHETAEAI
jgi:hypothetical protein